MKRKGHSLINMQINKNKWETKNQVNQYIKRCSPRNHWKNQNKLLQWLAQKLRYLKTASIRIYWPSKNRFREKLRKYKKANFVSWVKEWISFSMMRVIGTYSINYVIAVVT